jgi:hypothetical protein
MHLAKHLSRLFAYCVVGVGALQSVAYLLDIPVLRGFAQATAASPLPLVFSHYRGLETFSPRFSILRKAPDGITEELPISPQLYATLPGPYNRRNVYGAAFAYGAVQRTPEERALVNRVLSYAMCPGGPIRSLMKGSPDDTLSVIVVPKGASDRLEIPVECR